VADIGVVIHEHFQGFNAFNEPIMVEVKPSRRNKGEGYSAPSLSHRAPTNFLIANSINNGARLAIY
jgi:hypothetical protein